MHPRQHRVTRSRRAHYALAAALASFVAPEDFAGLTAWCGLRPCSPDGLPYLGRFSRFSNLFAATGHAMMGVSLGPITGKLMSEILAGENTSIAIEQLSPDRYARCGRM